MSASGTLWTSGVGNSKPSSVLVLDGRVTDARSVILHGSTGGWVYVPVAPPTSVVSNCTWQDIVTEEGSVASATGKERRGEGKEVGARQGRKEGNQVDPPGSRRGAGDATLLYNDHNGLSNRTTPDGLRNGAKDVRALRGAVKIRGRSADFGDSRQRMEY
ncbi:hypothetical protein BJ165DRAFT_1407573 [Panaeolus papilionaceus]|nr:hypothetical protein BJ165DRAFT_1407573 [Panaeolus papilionaceus]